MRPPAGEPVYLHPGRLLVGTQGELFSTVLGTCVAVCLWDPRARVGGMNHYVLPYPVGGANASARFGEWAIPALLAQVEQAGGRRPSLVAKVFGGSASLGLRSEIGFRNAELAVALLAQARIPVVAQDTGGPQGRQVLFSAADGEAWVRRIRAAPSPAGKVNG